MDCSYPDEPTMEDAVDKLMSGDDFGSFMSPATDSLLKPESNLKSKSTDFPQTEHPSSQTSIDEGFSSSQCADSEAKCENNPDKEFPPDAFVWARLTKRGVYWPARVAHISEKTAKRPSESHVWLYLYDTESFSWVPRDFVIPFESEKSDSEAIANKSKAFKAALDKLELERVAETSGTSPVHSKIKRGPVPVSSLSSKKKSEVVAAGKAKTKKMNNVGSSDTNEDPETASVNSEGNQENGSSQASLKDEEDDFALTPDRVLDMLDKQLDMVSSSKYTSGTGSTQLVKKTATHSQSARKRTTAAHKTDEPRSKRAAPILCSDFSNDGLQLESTEGSSSSSPKGETAASHSAFSLGQSPSASPSKPANSSLLNSDNVSATSTAPSKSLSSSGSKKTTGSSLHAGGVAQIKPIRRTQPFDKNVGFIGMGQIGHALAELLLRQSFNVYLWNKTPQKCSDLRSLGAKICISAGDVMARSDVTFCCVTNTDSVREVLAGTNGALNEMKRSKSFVNMTTCDPKASTEFYQLVQMRGARYLETPLLGSRKDSTEGHFLLLAAGDYSLYEDVLPCLELFSKKRSYVGAAGKACEMQVLMNLLYGNQLAVLAETMALCRKSGVDKQQLLSVLQSSDLASPFLVEKAEMIVGGNEGYEPAEKRLCQQQHDLKIALGLSDQLMQAMPITASCNELFKRAVAWGDEDLDMAVVYKAACL